MSRREPYRQDADGGHPRPELSEAVDLMGSAMGDILDAFGTNDPELTLRALCSIREAIEVVSSHSLDKKAEVSS